MPRRALFGVIGLTALLSFLPFVAAAAHAGGFVARRNRRRGARVARAAHPPEPASGCARSRARARRSRRSRSPPRAASCSRPGEFAARHAARLARLPDVTPEELNDAAWMIAIDEESPPELLEAALALAERAVDDTDDAEAHILDTLAEVHFQLGHRAEAVAAIDEAIQREPGRGLLPRAAPPLPRRARPATTGPIRRSHSRRRAPRSPALSV